MVKTPVRKSPKHKAGKNRGKADDDDDDESPLATPGAGSSSATPSLEQLRGIITSRVGISARPHADISFTIARAASAVGR